MTDETLKYAANRLTLWARGDLVTSRAPAVIFVPAEHVSWVRDPRSGLLDQGTLVLVRSKKGRLDPPSRVGTWLGYRGDFEEPGDEIQVGTELWVQLIDFSGISYLSVAGPTVIRLADADDALAFIREAASVRRKSAIERNLLHAGVEVGDRCALTDSPCTRGGIPARLYIDADGTVRTAPRGLPLGTAGDRLDAIAAAGQRYAARGIDPCVPQDIAAVLKQAPRDDRLMYLNSIDAIRTLQMRTGEPWYVSGVHGRVARDDTGPRVIPHRSDMLLLWSAANFVLFDVRQHRAFAMQAEAAEIADVLLSSASDADACTRLADRAAVQGNPVAAITAVRSTLGQCGVRLEVPA